MKIISSLPHHYIVRISYHRVDSKYDVPSILFR